MNSLLLKVKSNKVILWFKEESNFNELEISAVRITRTTLCLR